jgi:O-methyltransferase involved in polyketide biosynthesis
MEKKARSASAEAVSIQTSLHQMLDPAPKIIDDPIAPRLTDLTSDTSKAMIAVVESMTRPVKSPFRAVFIMRSRYTEDCLAEALIRGVRQYVILGAGWILLRIVSRRGLVPFESTKSIIRLRRSGSANALKLPG